VESQILDLEERKRMLLEMEEPLKKRRKGEAEESSLLFPKEIEFKLGGKVYTLTPLPLRKIKLLYQFRKLANKVGEGKTEEEEEKIWDSFVELFCKLLNEKDKDFILDHLTVPKIRELIDSLFKLSQPSSGEKKKERQFPN